MISKNDFVELVNIIKTASEDMEEYLPSDAFKDRTEKRRFRRELDLDGIRDWLLEFIGDLEDFVDARVIVKRDAEDWSPRFGISNFVAGGGDVDYVTVPQCGGKVFDTSTAEGLYDYMTMMNGSGINEDEDLIMGGFMHSAE